MNPLDAMSIQEKQALKDAMADIICWHYGFESAKPDYNAPPGIYVLRQFATNLQLHINTIKPD